MRSANEFEFCWRAKRSSLKIFACDYVAEEMISIPVFTCQTHPILHGTWVVIGGKNISPILKKETSSKNLKVFEFKVTRI